MMEKGTISRVRQDRTGRIQPGDGAEEIGFSAAVFHADWDTQAVAGATVDFVRSAGGTTAKAVFLHGLRQLSVSARSRARPRGVIVSVSDEGGEIESDGQRLGFSRKAFQSPDVHLIEGMRVEFEAHLRRPTLKLVRVAGQRRTRRKS